MSLLIDEGFEGTGYEWGGWSETTDPGCTIDEDNTTPAGIPEGTQCCEFYTIDNTNNLAYISDTDITGSDIPIFYCGCEFYLNNLPSTSGAFYLFYVTNSSSSLVLRVLLVNTGGTPYLRFDYYDGGVQQTSTVAISIQTWTKIEIKYDTTNSLWEWKIDGVSQADGSLTTPLIPRGIRAGIFAATSTTAITLYIDTVRVDDSTWTHPVGGTNYDISISDGLKLSELVSEKIDLQMNITDGIALSDTIAIIADLFTSITDGIIISDLTGMIANLNTSIADGITISDLNNEKLNINYLILDGIKISDTNSILMSFQIGVADGFELSDLQTAIADLLISIGDGLKLSDLVYYVDQDIGKVIIEITSIKPIITITSTKPIILIDSNIPNIIIN